MSSNPTPPDAPVDPTLLPAEDLRAVLAIGIERAGTLLSAGEAHVARTLLALDDGPATVYARLSARVPDVFEVAALTVPGVAPLQPALDALEAAGLIDRLVPWPARAEQLTIPRLKQACADLGLRRSGKKAALVERLSAHTHFVDGPWVRVRHKALVRRLERWAFLSRRADRSTLVVERLGHVTWPDYTPTSGPGLHPDRRALLRWEALLQAERAGTLDVPSALAALHSGDARAAGRLDFTHRLVGAIAELARSLEQKQPEQALALYQALVHAGRPPDPVRHARALERTGDRRGALALLRDSLAHRTGPSRLAIHRSGRRLARALRTGWAPDPPLAKPRARTLRLPPAPASASRPRYRVGDHSLTVESALVAWLGAHGRTAVHAENGLWTTLFALAFHEAYFLPVPGALPSRWLSGPLDLGSPGFRDRRAPTLDRLLAALRAGEGPTRIAAADARWRGTRLAGARWEIAPEVLVAVADGLGGPALADVLEVLLQRGWRAARGLPDLAILPGDPVVLPHAVPARLGPGLLLAEVKGPGDTVRDAQALWFHRLRSAGAPIALWEVRPLDADARPTPT